MSDNDEFTLADVEPEITPELLRPLKIIIAALSAGVLIFFLVCLFMYDLHETPSFRVHPQNIESFYHYFLIFGVVVFAIYTAYFFMNKILYDRERLVKMYNQPAQNIDSDNEVQRLFSVIIATTIIRMAMLEGAALFGLVLLYLSINNDVIYATNDVWICTVPMLVLFFMAFRLYPKKEKVAAEIIKINDILEGKSQ